MKDISGIRMEDHMKTYDQITKDMTGLADEAVEAISAVAYDKPSKELATKVVSQNAKYRQDLAVITEEQTKQKESVGMIRMGAAGVIGSMPLEKQKDEIVNTLHNMNDNMKEYTKDVESRLEKALLAMGGKEVARKYGFETMGAKNVDEFMTDDRKQHELKDTQAFNRKLIKL